MVSTRNLQEFGRKLDIVPSVLDDLYTSLSRIIFCPGVGLKLVTLIAGVTRF